MKKYYKFCILFCFFILVIWGFDKFLFRRSHINVRNENEEKNSKEISSQTELISPTRIQTAKKTVIVKKNKIAKKTSLLFAGDTMLARTIGKKIELGKNPFLHVKEEFKKNDFVILNLECVISNQGISRAGKKFTFRAPVKSLEYLKKSNVSIVSIANNHTMDYGKQAFLEMLSLLDQNKIDYFGGGENLEKALKPYIISKNRISIAFFGFNEVESWFTKVTEIKPGSAFFGDSLLKSIREAKEVSDLVVVMPHWGIEYQKNNSKIQQAKAYKLIEAGADLIVGAHPHVKQNMEIYQDKYIYYSLGNFVFDQMPYRKDGSEKGNMLQVHIEDQEIKTTKLIPIKLNLEGIPVLE